MLVEPSPKLQFQLLMGLPALSAPAGVNLTVRGSSPLVGLTVTAIGVSSVTKTPST